MISVVVPVKGERPEAAAHFRSLTSHSAAEVVVADGGGDAETTEAFRRVGARVLAGYGTRGARLHRATKEARGEAFLFVHADSRLPEGAVDLVRRALHEGAAAGAFSLGYQGANPGLRWIAAWANLRSHWLKLPFGDQGIFCRRDVYEQSGGFRDMAICDDLDFVRRLRRIAPFRILPEKTLTSPRRYQDRGPIRQVLRNWRVQAGYFAGVPAEKLERWYNAR